MAVWNFVRWNKRTNDFSRHPICKRLSRFGAVNEVVQRIEAAMHLNSVNRTAGAITFGPWLFEKTAFGLKCFHIPELVWLYKKAQSIPSISSLLGHRLPHCYTTAMETRWNFERDRSR